MALVKTMKWFGTGRGVLFGALVCGAMSFVACSELDPVSVESLCEGPGPVREECPQCQGPDVLAAECPQCQQSGADERCAPPASSEQGGPITTEPGVDGGPNTSGEGAPSEPGSNSDGSEPQDGAQGGDGAMGTAGRGATPPEGNGGEGGSGQPDPTQPSRACATDQDCLDLDPAFPACRPDGSCIECLRHEHCSEGRQCDSLTNLCVQCVDANGCEALGQVCNVSTRMCVQCLGNGDCTDPAAPACTTASQCVACTDDSFCPEETPACDAMACYECRNDGYCNSAGKHACIEAEHRCVECETDAHCRSEAGRPHCLVEGNACVECLTNADCSDPSASRCDDESHTCVGCTGHTDCSEFASSAPRCVEGKGCVACDSDDGICNGKACILSQNICSDTDRQSVEGCGECVTSDECIPGHVCVNLRFGSYDTGNFCMPNLPDFRACPRPFGREIANVMTLDGFRVRTLCALPEMTTCPALIDTLEGKTCNDNNAECGLGRPVLGVNDGMCPARVCTYNCSGDEFCPNGMVCSEEQAICLK